MSFILQKSISPRLLLLRGKRYTTQPTPSGPCEEKLRVLLLKTFPKAKSIEVVDISGGCGAMFDISVVAPELKGLNIVKQHRLVNEALKEEIKDMHGLRIHTTVPPED